MLPVLRLLMAQMPQDFGLIENVAPKKWYLFGDRQTAHPSG